MKKEFKITGMHCGSCALSIDFDLEDLDGIKSAKTSYAQAKTEIEFDQGKVTEEMIVQTIQKSGYKAEFSKPLNER
ncbi:hypothetical protein A3B45_04775 [Candidatus Daviesbacteria bacterium RIFCSPLOWO2_01_FULL_39_12]|uniref:HMA domain-containing protein n=1 Tax=Candidatus Daviesbacteria bacterium RIFCSPLOWO2_01_FULL_39_12 TaxID=1797785 RepID=A0A1F5KLG3_9BACT|nr:MAG: hypothetical protein A3D79_01200 [Candidatus Daviesbacteria bacterium RIFCSPHIGHO2_02_FULL_39_8]OGE41669.1 MAG: hypothetical protein A3B45_04775 [Candidatus Daviesbacteria bacterium RIFCSPLOWO2_01_FULL_39_12]